MKRRIVWAALALWLGGVALAVDVSQAAAESRGPAGAAGADAGPAAGRERGGPERGAAPGPAGANPAGANAGRSAPGTGDSGGDGRDRLRQADRGEGSGTPRLAQVALPPAAERAVPASPGPVVIELFTSQGCMACPAADALLADLAARADVLALAFHVDYWDYLGWTDKFAQPEFTSRQKGYARAARERMIYTPQMVVGGTEAMVAPRAAEIGAVIAKHAAQAGLTARVHLRITQHPDGLVISLEAEPPLEAPALVQLIRYLPHERVEIRGGENAGRVIDYANVVTDWTPLAEWDGRAPLRLGAETPGTARTAVIVQEMRRDGSHGLPGPILAAARAD